MTQKLRVLIVEDNERDAALLVRELQRGGYELTYERVETAEAMSAALANQVWDIVVSDFVMPRFSAQAALTLVRERQSDLPVIIVSGTVGEEVAVEAMRAGARDFMAKGKFTRLMPAIEREMREAAERVKRRAIENQLRHAQSQAEAEAKAAMARYAEVLDMAADAIVSVDDEQRIVVFNAAASKMLGYEADEVLGKPLDILFPPDAVEIYRHHLQAFGAGPDGAKQLTGRPSLSARRKDGKLIDIEAGISKRSENGRPLLTAVVRDITDRNKMEEQLRHAQKMEAIGNLTGGMAHDFNNLLGIIIGNLDLLRERTRKDAASDELARDALDAAIRGGDLTRRLLAFARRQPLQPQRIEINEIVERVSKLLGRTLGEDIEIALDPGADVWPVVVDPAQLESSLVNLANNARDAMPKGGRLLITTANRHLDEDYAGHHLEVAVGDYAMIEVSDVGGGMPPEVASRIFEPFFTTKELGKGTGLGLSMVFGFVKQSGGHINVYSEVGIGTTFRLYLRRAVAEAEVATVAIAKPLARGGGETVLVVEDNMRLRRVVVRQFNDFGYRVVEAEDARAALTVLESERVDLVFTDITMPGGVSGRELAYTVSARWPNVKVILTSGFPEAKLNNKGEPPITFRLLSKPYRREDLGNIVREVLDGK